MKTIILALTFLSASMASADHACSALQNFVGKYQMVSYTCRGFFGDKLSVEFNVEYRPYTYTNYLITSGPMSTGVSTLPSSLDRCGLVGDTLTVYSCANSSCIPKVQAYSFRGDRATVYASPCRAEFVRQY